MNYSIIVGMSIWTILGIVYFIIFVLDNTAETRTPSRKMLLYNIIIGGPIVWLFVIFLILAVIIIAMCLCFAIIDEILGEWLCLRK